MRLLRVGSTRLNVRDCGSVESPESPFGSLAVLLAEGRSSVTVAGSKESVAARKFNSVAPVSMKGGEADGCCGDEASTGGEGGGEGDEAGSAGDGWALLLLDGGGSLLLLDGVPDGAAGGTGPSEPAAGSVGNQV